MRVQGTTSARTTGTKSLRRGAGGLFGLGQGPGADAAAAPSAAGIAAIGGLLALQDMDEPGLATERAVARGHDLLDRLRTLQADLLDGRLDRGTLEGLARATAAGVPAGAEPALVRLVREIEVRAAVELAKLDTSEPDRPGAAVLTLPPDDAPPPRAACLRAYRAPAADG